MGINSEKMFKKVMIENEYDNKSTLKMLYNTLSDIVYKSNKGFAERKGFEPSIRY